MGGCDGRFSFSLRIGEVGKLEDRDEPSVEIDGEPCITIRISGSETDLCKLGAHRTLVETGCALCPSQGSAHRLDMKTWRPLAPTRVSRSTIANKINRFLKNLAMGRGMGPVGVSSYSPREGCATPLHSNGAAPIDIHRWGRWKLPVYMKYVWRGNVRLHTISYDIKRRGI